MGTKTVQIEDFLAERQRLPVVDVRAPIEFAKGHIPDAINVPLFDDDERKRIGTTYKNQGRITAVKLGLNLIGPKMLQLVDTVEQFCRSAGHMEIESGRIPLLIYCARGGMRSDSMGWLLEQVDFQVSRLAGGYKSYRRAVQEYFDRQWNLIAITGMTGAGKTKVLHELAAAGEQVIDLEGLACHRGSAFGGIGQREQPSNEHFENLIFEGLRNLDPKKRIWIEDESRAIGKCVIPHSFFEQLHDAPAVFIDVNVQQRADFLVAEYGALETADMIAAVERIAKRLGGQNVKAAIEALQAGNLRRCAEILLVYYDKTYSICQQKNPRQRVERVKISAEASKLDEVLQASTRL